MNKTQDIVTSCILLGISGLGFAFTTTLPPAPSSSTFGPAFFPNVILILLSACACLQFAIALFGRASGKPHSPMTADAWKRVLLLIALFTGYIALFLNAGFAVSTPVFLYLAQIVFGRRDWFRMGAYAAIITAVAYTVLTWVFQVQLP